MVPEEILMRKPKSLRWIKGEWNKPWYALHIVGDVIIVLILLKYLAGHDMLSFVWVLKLSAIFFLADVAMHTILQKD